MSYSRAQHRYSPVALRLIYLSFLSGPRSEKTCLRGFANNKGTDQPAHSRSLISAFVFRLLKSIISRLASSEISIFYVVSVAEETSLSVVLSETPKTGFVTSRLNCSHYTIVPYSGNELVCICEEYSGYVVEYLT